MYVGKVIILDGKKVRKVVIIKFFYYIVYRISVKKLMYVKNILLDNFMRFVVVVVVNIYLYLLYFVNILLGLRYCLFILFLNGLSWFWMYCREKYKVYYLLIGGLIIVEVIFFGDNLRRVVMIVGLLLSIYC